LSGTAWLQINRKVYGKTIRQGRLKIFSCQNLCCRTLAYYIPGCIPYYCLRKTAGNSPVAYLGIECRRKEKGNRNKKKKSPIEA
jgi:hypothetical protein